VRELEVEVGVHQRGEDHRVEALGRTMDALDLGSGADGDDGVTVEGDGAVADGDRIPFVLRLRARCAGATLRMNGRVGPFALSVGPGTVRARSRRA
jgi:hypothetical protein